MASLEQYPHPSVAVDVAVLTTPPGPRARLSVLTIARAETHARGIPRLPGTFLHEGERLADAVRRVLRNKVGLTGSTPTQLRVFDAPARDDRGWVLSVAHLDVLPFTSVERALGGGVELHPVDDVPPLAFDHDEIVAAAALRVREAYSSGPDPYRLLDSPFTLLELQRAHEAVAGAPLMKDSFRRRMEEQLEATGQVRSGTVGKPARLWRRRAV